MRSHGTSGENARSQEAPLNAALLLALFFTVVLLAITTYFIMGSLPLLILKHDTPMDARFVRGFFNAYYRAVPLAAMCAAVSYAFAGRPVYALATAALAVLAELVRRFVIPRMDALRGRLQSDEDGRFVPAFRRVHLTAIVANVVQLAITVGSLVTLSMQSR